MTVTKTTGQLFGQHRETHEISSHDNSGNFHTEIIGTLDGFTRQITIVQTSMIAALYSLLVLCVTKPASSSFAKYLDHPILQLA